VPSGDAVDASAKASISCVKQRAMRPLKSRHSTIRPNRKATMGHRGCPTAELSTDGEAVDAGAKAGISCRKQRTARPRTLPWQSRLQRILAWNRMMTMRRRRRWAAKPSMRARGKHQLREAADGAPEGVAVSDNHDLRSGFSKIPLHWLLLALGIQNLKNSLSCTLHSEWGIPRIQSSKCSNSRHFAMVCARGAGKSGNSKRQ
jgi:hypothetical protein